ncbi:SRPBCC family protein [Nocardia stercoris]|uniref:SRPBCC family protein n=1 Tax=Nocardia stercoris TaxID=2483361 RepID=A0A3M2L9A3_9NOCA|nr:SRPBCC family protein [Nocardia stercoris]RMI34149.1 SRPBCC family protein [Nocardia stercoris]
MTDVKISVECAATAETAFAYVNDYRTAPQYMAEVHAISPLTDQIEGVGATFDVTVKLGPATLHTTVEVARSEPGVVLAMKSVNGFQVETTYNFTDLGGGRCGLVVDFDYRVAPGLAGKVLGKTIEPFVKIAAAQMTKRLSAEIEAYHLSR